MILFAETVVLCLVFFILCILGTGTDDKNLKHYSSYPDEVQERISKVKEYQGRYKSTSKTAVFMGNLLLFLVLFLLLGIFIREKSFLQNFLCLLILGQTLNAFDLIVVDLLWWRNTKRIRFSKIPDKKLYKSSKKHVSAFLRAVILYIVVALIDGYILTLC